MARSLFDSSLRARLGGLVCQVAELTQIWAAVALEYGVITERWLFGTRRHCAFAARISRASRQRPRGRSHLVTQVADRNARRDDRGRRQLARRGLGRVWHSTTFQERVEP